MHASAAMANTIRIYLSREEKRAAPNVREWMPLNALPMRHPSRGGEKSRHATIAFHHLFQRHADSEAFKFGFRALAALR